MLNIALQVPGTLTLVLGAISASILIVGAVVALWNWERLRRYAPRITDKYAEGAVITYYDQNGRATAQIPCIYVYIKMDPKNEAIHNCEVRVADDWYAFFDSWGVFRYDVTRPENLHLGRYEIDVEKERVKFVKPMWEAQVVRRYGGWIGQDAEFRGGKLELAMVGEVNGKRLERKLVVEIGVKELLGARKWQKSAIESAGDLVELADKIMSDFVRSV